MAETPCYGKWELFDSIELRDHLAARAICQTCPVILNCARELNDVRANAGVYGQPEGTWAGQLATQPTETTRKRLAAMSRRERLDAEDARYTTETARQARSAFAAGDRSEWATTGNRVYERRRRTNHRGRVA